MDSKPKVVCLGMGRTGTMSLMAALNHLGFGPCYHMRNLVDNKDPNEIKTWYDLGKGSATLDDLREILKDYNSFLDFPVAINCDKMYAAYPNAKFILTTRDPASWETSMKATLVPTIIGFRDTPDPSPFVAGLSKWYSEELQGYHGGRLFEDFQGGLRAHEQRVRDTIPSDKLLVYDLSQGWDPLVNFLGVEKPDMKFPHVNRTEDFLYELRKYMGSHEDSH